MLVRKIIDARILVWFDSKVSILKDSWLNVFKRIKDDNLYRLCATIPQVLFAKIDNYRLDLVVWRLIFGHENTHSLEVLKRE